MHELTLRPATSEDGEFLYGLLKTTMGGYVERMWGWDEAWQRTYFWSRFDPAENQIVVLDEIDIGVLAVEEREEDLFLSRIYLLPPYQRRGIGTQLIRSVLERGRVLGVPVRLQVLVNNPARRLYERLGFHAVGGTETHYDMEALPGPARDPV